MSKLKGLFKTAAELTGDIAEDEPLHDALIQEEQKEQLEQDRSILDEGGADSRKAQKEAERQVVSAAEDSLTKLHVIQRGRCPECGEHLHRHLFATICEGCGWHTFDTPRQGDDPVRVHLKGGTVIEGQRCYRVRNGAVLVVREDVVQAKVTRDAIEWIEYVWSDAEVEQRHRQVAERLDIRCAWCTEAADPGCDGFHMAHVAVGATQERYCFCSDECYEGFRRMYPARVDRDCYERACADCDQCLRRYGDEAEGIRLLAKDYLRVGSSAEDAPKAANSAAVG